MGFAFAGLCGIFWEFWEFICDSVGGMNLQRYATLDGTPFIGREALMDTMGDLLTNTIGAAQSLKMARLALMPFGAEIVSSRY